MFSLLEEGSGYKSNCLSSSMTLEIPAPGVRNGRGTGRGESNSSDLAS